MSTKPLKGRFQPASGHPGLIIGLVVASLLCTTGCERGEVFDSPFDASLAYAEVEALVAISPRDAGTPGARQAAEHLLQRLKNFGIDAEINSFNDATPSGEKPFHNVVGRIPGKTDQWIILGSHYDTMPGIPDFEGANDGGSSTGVLLETARLLAHKKPEIGIIFAFFDGEEAVSDYGPNDGLHGSRHMATALAASGEAKNIKAMVLLDMVGDRGDLHFTIPYNSSPTLVKEVLAAAESVGCRDYFSLARQTIITDDHQPFLNIGIPAVDIIDFHFGSEMNLNDYWHTADDRMENISAQSLEISGNILLALLERLLT